MSIAPAEPSGSPDPAERLCQLWQEGQQPDLDDFLARFGPLKPEQLVDVLHVDQRQRWQAGEPILAETYLQRYPAVGANAQTAVDLIYSEFRFRHDNGEEPGVDDYLQRFPQYRTLLGEQFQFYRELRGYAAQRGYKDGWVFYKCREKGFTPPWDWKNSSPAQPSPAVAAWVRSRNIAFAKARGAS